MAVMKIPEIIDILRQDYARFPTEQTYTLYAEDVFFQDPLTSFYGVQRYQAMIGLIQQWFIDVRMDLYEIELIDAQICTRWRLSWYAPLPWRPHLVITGRSQLSLNAYGQICRHIDIWDCSRLDVLRQVFRWK
jgi:hypothetical protein